MKQSEVALSSEEWYNLGQADPRSVYKNIFAGIKKYEFIGCQYFISGLPYVCKNWDGSSDPGKCTYKNDSDATDIPSGYGKGSCDFLGRRSWCTKYESTSDDEDSKFDPAWVCCAINPYFSGLTKKLTTKDEQGNDTTTGYNLRAITKAEVTGYCPDDSGVGKCDGHGCGRGCDVTESMAILDVLKKPVVCKYYKPWSMGFGAVEPQSYEKAIREYGDIYNEEYSGFMESQKLGTRLPYGFDVYNLRATYQKCYHWDSEYIGLFTYRVVDGANDYINMSMNASTTCKCEDSRADPYRTIFTEEDKNEQGKSILPSAWILRKVWSKANTVVCNGAKPECPCYKGEWLYCTDEQMADGMRISPYQVLELRFWTNDWGSQEEYDKFFENRPNWEDNTTADIYTFSQWKRDDSDSTDSEHVVEKSVMAGKCFHLNIPDNYFNKRFNKDYVTITPVQYTPYSSNSDTGTTTTDQRYFPTLIRRLWTLDIKPLIVIYPGPSVVSGTETDFCERFASNIDGDKISVVGCTSPYVKVYAMNMNEVGMLEYISYFDTADDISAYDEKLEFYQFMDDNIDDLRIAHPHHIIGCETSRFGLFNMGYLPVSFEVDTEIAVLVRYNNSTWNFLKRKVHTNFCGGLISQTAFDYTASGDQTLPGVFLPAAQAKFDVSMMGAAKDYDLYSVWSNEVPDIPAGADGYSEYAYSLEWEVKENVQCSDWTRIGQTYYIWVEIDDTDLNNVLRWAFTSAFLTIKENGLDRKIEYSLLSPYCGSSIGSSADRQSLPPNVLILEPKNPADLINLIKKDDITLEISYKYLKFNIGSEERDLAITEFPTTYSGSTSTRFVDSPFSFDFLYSKGQQVDTYEVKNIRSATLALMAFFKTEKGCVTSAFATKLYVNVPLVYCRNIEIFYEHRAEAVVYRLEPHSGFITEETRDLPPTNTGRNIIHAETAPCGDHDTNALGIGPMWYPFNKCSSSKTYHQFMQGAFCTMGYEGSGSEKWKIIAGTAYRQDYRYCSAQDYMAWCEEGGNWLSSCGVPWAFMYSKANNHYFAGYGNIVANVDKKYYERCQWTLPPFGNYARDFTERYMSKDHVPYVDTTGWMPTRKDIWMPMVIDRSSFFMSFNCFDSYSYSNALDCFSFMDQMNFWMCDTIAEKMGPTGYSKDIQRWAWEDLFGISGISAYYPKPLIYKDDNVYAYFYHFKYDDFVWAWHEPWQDIDRNTDEKGQLIFFTLTKPDYYYDVIKTEHRFICSEDEHRIVYTAPVFERGKLTTYPSISIDDAYPRYFKVMYDDYSVVELVGWADEGNGSADGSGGNLDGGSSGSSIYELTSGSEWTHSVNAIFSSEAGSTIEEAITDNRYYFYDPTDLTLKHYYNRGLIFDIYKSNLYRLPMKEDQATDIEIVKLTKEEPKEFVGVGDVSDFIATTSGSSFSLKVDFTGTDEGVCVSKIIFNGLWGSYTSDQGGENHSAFYSKPGATITYKSAFDDKSILTLDSFDYEDPLERPIDSSVRKNVDNFVKTRKYKVFPKYMIKDRIATLYIDLKSKGGQGILVSSVDIYLSEYEDREEKIYVWERRYIPSTQTSRGETSVNLDGPEQLLSGRGEGGPHFPALGGPHREMFKTMNKMRGVWAGPASETFSKEKVDITRDNLHDKEISVQKKMYTDAYGYELVGDEIIYSFQMPNEIDALFVGIDEFYTNNPRFTCTSKKLPWEKHGVANSLVQYPYWFPGGHYWQWSAGFMRLNCYLFGDIHEVYSGQIIHVSHDGVDMSAVDPGNSYYNYRWTYQTMILDQFGFTASSKSSRYDLVTPPLVAYRDQVNAYRAYRNSHYHDGEKY